ncbi:MAG: radical SAM protein [Dissulfurispiraceae bacterium]
MRVGLIDFDSKIVNLALAKLSSYHKARGDTVILNPSCAVGIDKAYCSVVFTRSKEKASLLSGTFDNISFGGTGWDLTVTLPDEIEALRPDYDLYTAADIYRRLAGIMTKKKRMQKSQTIVDAGIGFTSRGCVRKCGFCFVPKKEPVFCAASEIRDIVNPRSNVLILLDNNFTAAPNCLEKLREIKERGLVVDFTQGIDIRTMTPEIAKALSEIKHLRSIHFAWDFPDQETLIFRGVNILSRFIKPWRYLCLFLVGYNSCFEADMYRFNKLIEVGIDPYVMVWNNKSDARLRHFARWVNGRIYTKCRKFDDYMPWAKVCDQYLATSQQTLFAA